MRHLEKMCGYGYHACKAISVSIVLFSLVLFFLPETFIKDYNLNIYFDSFVSFQAPEGRIVLNRRNPDLFLNFLSFLAYLMGAVPYFIELYFTSQILKKYKQSDFFSTPVTKLYNYLSLTFLVDGLFIHSLVESLSILFASLANPAGQRYLVIGFGTPNLHVVFIGFVLFILTSIMKKAQQLQEEQSYTV